MREKVNVRVMKRVDLFTVYGRTGEKKGREKREEIGVGGKEGGRWG